MSGLHIDRVIGITQAIRSAIDGVIGQLIREHKTFTWALDEKARVIFRHPMHSKLPQWAQADLSAYFQGQLHVIDSHMTVFAFKYGDKLYQTNLSKKGGLVDWPTWDEMYDFVVDQPTGLHQTKGTYKNFTEFEKAECIESGIYWPDGKPYSVKVGAH